MKRNELYYLSACWQNSETILVETDEQVEELWQEILRYGFHKIKRNTDLYQKACLQLDLNPKYSRIYQTNNYSCKFGGLSKYVYFTDKNSK